MQGECKGTLNFWPKSETNPFVKMQISQVSKINVLYSRKGYFLSRTLPNTLFDQFGRERWR